MGDCPAICLNIFNDGTAYYKIEKNIRQRSGNYRGKITSNKLNEIMSLIKYMDILNLKDDYQVQSTDMPSSKLNVYFSDGSVKEINDYGLQGTLGLVRLYDLLFALRLEQKWK